MEGNRLIQFISLASSNMKILLNRNITNKKKVNHRRYLKKQLFMSPYANAESEKQKSQRGRHNRHKIGTNQRSPTASMRSKVADSLGHIQAFHSPESLPISRPCFSHDTVATENIQYSREETEPQSFDQQQRQYFQYSHQRPGQDSRWCGYYQRQALQEGGQRVEHGEHIANRAALGATQYGHHLAPTDNVNNARVMDAGSQVSLPCNVQYPYNPFYSYSGANSMFAPGEPTTHGTGISSQFNDRVASVSPNTSFYGTAPVSNDTTTHGDGRALIQADAERNEQLMTINYDTANGGNGQGVYLSGQHHDTTRIPLLSLCNTVVTFEDLVVPTIPHSVQKDHPKTMLSLSEDITPADTLCSEEGGTDLSGLLEYFKNEQMDLSDIV